MSIYIEFIGLWGSGKSTILKELIRVSKDKNLLVSGENEFCKLNKIKRHFYPVWYAFISPTVLKGLFGLGGYFFKIKPADALERIFYYKLIKIYLSKNFIIRRNPSKGYIWEGESHLLICMDLSKLHDREIVKLLKIFLPINTTRLIVHIKTPLKTSFERASKRNLSSSQKAMIFKKSEEEQYKIYNRMKINEERIVNIFKKMNDNFVLEIDGTMSPKNNASKILKIFKTLYKR
jgi:ABC-type dipeptide/oligopeptide/nickel transport system ATPase component